MNLLDVNPLEVNVSGQEGLPGFSAFVLGKWVHGDEALRACRVDPQSVVFDVWKDLDLQPVQPPVGARHRADLAVGQLTSLKLSTENPWFAAVPSTWTKDRLQVFLGVAQQCHLNVAGLSPRCMVVARSAGLGSEPLTVLEWDWTELRILYLEVVKGEWTQIETTVVPEAGILGCFRRESRLAANWMLDQHRVDPLHSGTTEQQLFDDWWMWHQGKSSAWTIALGGSVLTVSDQAEDLRQSHLGWLEKAGVKDETRTLMPGMLKHVLGFQQVHEAQVSGEGLGESLGLTGGSGARWMETLPAETKLKATVLPVTHIVCEGVAVRVEEVADWKPGEMVTLPDGRTGLAIHVPQR